MKKKNTRIQERRIRRAEQAKSYEAMQKMRDHTAVENFHRRPYCVGRY